MKAVLLSTGPMALRMIALCVSRDRASSAQVAIELERRALIVGEILVVGERSGKRCGLMILGLQVVGRLLVHYFAATGPQFLPNPPDVAERVDAGHDLPQDFVDEEAHAGVAVRTEPLKAERVLLVERLSQRL